MYFAKNIKDSFGDWITKKVVVLNIVNEPLNIRGRVSGSNWSVKYITPSVFGDGKQVNTEYFSMKKEAFDFIKDVKNTL